MKQPGSDRSQFVDKPAKSRSAAGVILNRHRHRRTRRFVLSRRNAHTPEAKNTADKLASRQNRHPPQKLNRNQERDQCHGGKISSQ